MKLGLFAHARARWVLRDLGLPAAPDGSKQPRHVPKTPWPGRPADRVQDAQSIDVGAEGRHGNRVADHHHRREGFRSRRAPRVLAVASAGGHFTQLCRLMPALKDCDVTFVTTDAALQVEVASKASECGLTRASFLVTTEANRWQKKLLARSAAEIGLILMKVRPTVVITTGAAPGYFALRLAALAGIRTAWIDSIANADALSLSGSKAGKHADLWLTQWEHLSRPDGPKYQGAVV